MNFLLQFESPHEVHDYVKLHIGDTPASKEFTRQFLERAKQCKQQKSTTSGSPSSMPQVKQPSLPCSNVNDHFFYSSRSLNQNRHINNKTIHYLVLPFLHNHPVNMKTLPLSQTLVRPRHQLGQMEVERKRRRVKCRRLIRLQYWVSV